MYRSRVIKELNEAKKFKEANILLSAKVEDCYAWRGYLFGSEESPYKDGIFEIKLNLPTNYPMSPPKIVFITKIFHPNINYDTGEICLDILKDQWTPVWTLESACLAILDLLNHPNPDSPLNCDAGIF
jgi:peroxin-4